MARSPSSAGSRGTAAVSLSAGSGGADAPISFLQATKLIETSEEKTLAKMQALESRIDVRLSRLDDIPTWSQQLVLALSIGVSTIVTLAGLLVAFLSFGGDRFDGGVQYTSATYQNAAEAKKAADSVERTASKIDLMLRRMEQKIDEGKRLETPQNK